MSSVTPYKGMSPYNIEDEMAEVVVDNPCTLPMLLRIPSSEKYTFSMWVKGNMTIGVCLDEQVLLVITATDEWERHIITFDALQGDAFFLRLSVGECYLFNTKLERGNVPTDYTIAPEDDIEKFKDLSTEITAVAGQIDIKVSEYLHSQEGIENISEIIIDPTNIALISDRIDLTGKVSFNSFDNTVTENLDGLYDAKGTASNTVGALYHPGTTLIDGGNIYTDNLTAKKVHVNDESGNTVFDADATQNTVQIGGFNVSQDKLSSDTISLESSSLKVYGSKTSGFKNYLDLKNGIINAKVENSNTVYAIFGAQGRSAGGYISYNGFLYLLGADGKGTAISGGTVSAERVLVGENDVIHEGNIGSQSVNYANSSGYASSSGSASSSSSSGALANTGYGNGNLTYLQTSGDFDGNSGWCHYIICNHGDGASYYHHTLALPFWDVPMYRRQTGSTGNVTPWYKFITDENISSQSVSKSNRTIGVDGYNDSYYLSVSGGTPCVRMYGASDYTAKDNVAQLGTSNSRWSVIYAVNGTIQKSDRNAKKDFAEFTDKEDALFDMLKPQKYRFIDGNSGRIHFGFISQDVEDSLAELGMDGMDFAGFCKDKKVISRMDEDGHEIDEEVLDKDGNTIWEYSLRYDEFISLNTHQIQKAKKRINQLESEVADLKDEVAELKELVKSLIK